MSGWFNPETIKVDFEDLGYSQFWVDVKKPGSLLYGEMLGLDKLGEDSPPKEVMGALALMIQDWNLTDPVTEEALSVPTQKDPTPLYRLPNAFLRLLQQRITAESEAFAGPEGVLKKAKEMPLEAISEESRE